MSSLFSGEGRSIRMSPDPVWSAPFHLWKTGRDVCWPPPLPVLAGCCSPQRVDSSPLNRGWPWNLPWPTVMGSPRLDCGKPCTFHLGLCWSPEHSCMKSNCCEVPLLWASQVRRLPKSERGWPAHSCSSYASTGARHVRNLGENHPAEPSQHREPYKILPPPLPLKISTEV